MSINFIHLFLSPISRFHSQFEGLSGRLILLLLGKHWKINCACAKVRYGVLGEFEKDIIPSGKGVGAGGDLLCFDVCKIEVV